MSVLAHRLLPLLRQVLLPQLPLPVLPVQLEELLGELLPLQEVPEARWQVWWMVLSHRSRPSSAVLRSDLWR